LAIGETKIMGNGIAYSWVRSNSDGEPIAVGVTFTESALEGLPAEKPGNGFDGYEFPLQLPKHQAKLTPFDHIALDWNPKGHIPPGIYDVPHFDIHFYADPIEERAKITLEGEDMARCQKAPDASFLPEGYMYAPGSEYKFMGAHWVDTAAPELGGKPFTHTFIFGSYDGRVVFWEPMVTMAYLKTLPDLLAEIKQPKDFERKGLCYPTKYGIRYSAERREFTVWLEGIVKR
jgi:hypothetical protein